MKGRTPGEDAFGGMNPGARAERSGHTKRKRLRGEIGVQGDIRDDKKIPYVGCEAVGQRGENRRPIGKRDLIGDFL